jgi:23S rRNA (pseudouridine1915-N3)-methyltransferase
MMFHVVAVGRMKDSGVKSLCEDYLQRSNRYVTVAVHEVPDARRARTQAAVRQEEAENLLRAIPDSAHAVALTRDGSQPDSRAFAKRMGRWREEARDVAFVVGGAYGLHDRVLQRASERISLSSMTFPHEIARLLLLEQLYRGNTILRGEPYHKGA